MKKLLLILLFLLVCPVSSYAKDIPHKDVALRLYRIKYDAHTNNCLFRAQMYHNYLVSKGVECRLVIGYAGKNNFYRHAWNEIKINNEWYIVNLTNKPYTWGVWDTSNYKGLELTPKKYYYKEFIGEKENG